MNYIDGLECPKCKRTDAFEITVSLTLVVGKDGVQGVALSSDLVESLRWNAESECRCFCGQKGKVKDFMRSVWSWSIPTEVMDALKGDPNDEA